MHVLFTSSPLPKRPNNFFSGLWRRDNVERNAKHVSTLTLSSERAAKSQNKMVADTADRKWNLFVFETRINTSMRLPRLPPVSFRNQLTFVA